MLLQNTPESQSSPMETKIFLNFLLNSFCTLIQELGSINSKIIMGDYQSNFELPKKIEHHLATLSKIYSQDGKTQLQELLFNSQIRVHEELNCNNWDEGTYGHGLILVVPEVLYLKTVKQKSTLQDQIKNDINQIIMSTTSILPRLFLKSRKLVNGIGGRSLAYSFPGNELYSPILRIGFGGKMDSGCFSPIKLILKEKQQALRNAFQHSEYRDLWFMRIFTPIKNDKMRLRMLFPR